MPQPWAKLGLAARILWYAPGTFWAVFIFVLSVTPPNNYPVCNMFGFIPMDKFGHWGCYGLLISCYLPALQRQYKNVKSRFIAEIILIALAISFGVTIEFIQRLPIVNRDFEVMDMVADAVGCFSGYFGYKLVAWWTKAAEAN